ncbi:hypothetical protein LSH36_572g00064 [Paralvinella palmiformis]|uniref:C-type lectin domain-containing protein n=1 Tax=Paralvinella palmiformis TaxID=53620 RepID=A0AAD9MVK8_9ANNE|nr:hypothetical protein LSH36_572g00064 [Paralvinella palmiformis]
MVREACRQYGGDLPVLDSQLALDLALRILRSSDRKSIFPVYCPRGAFTFNSNQRIMCYNYFRERVTFQEAENTCSPIGGSSMLVITNDAEQQAIASYIGRTNISSDSGVWIGLHDRLTDGVWQWTDGSVYGFNKFAPSEPNGLPGSHCATMSPAESMLWVATNCTDKLGFICAGRAMYCKSI